jgi:hypothetical protein
LHTRTPPHLAHPRIWHIPASCTRPRPRILHIPHLAHAHAPASCTRPRPASCTRPHTVRVGAARISANSACSALAHARILRIPASCAPAAARRRTAVALGATRDARPPGFTRVHQGSPGFTRALLQVHQGSPGLCCRFTRVHQGSPGLCCRLTRVHLARPAAPDVLLSLLPTGRNDGTQGHQFDQVWECAESLCVCVCCSWVGEY